MLRATEVMFFLGGYQDSNSLKKLWYNWIQATMYGLQCKLYNAQSERTDHTVSRLYMEESICHAHMSLRVAQKCLASAFTATGVKLEWWALRAAEAMFFLGGSWPTLCS